MTDFRIILSTKGKYFEIDLSKGKAVSLSKKGLGEPLGNPSAIPGEPGEPFGSVFLKKKLGNFRKRGLFLGKHKKS